MRLIEQALAPQRPLEYRLRHLEAHPLAQLPQARVQQTLMRVDEASRQGVEPLAGRRGAPDQQHMPRLHDHRVDGNEDGRVGRLGPGAAILIEQHLLLDQLTVVITGAEGV